MDYVKEVIYKYIQLKYGSLKKSPFDYQKIRNTINSLQKEHFNPHNLLTLDIKSPYGGHRKFIPIGGDSQKLIVFIHGGGFIFGQALYDNIAPNLAYYTGYPVLSLEYPKAPENPFPMAINSCFEQYKTLLEKGYLPQDLVLAGGSAGANLALSLLIKIRDEGLPQPQGAILLSPWLDMTLDCARTTDLKMAKDPILSIEQLQFAREKYHPTNEGYDHPYLSPVYADLSGICELWVDVDKQEILKEDSLKLEEKAIQYQIKTKLRLRQKSFHYFHIVSFLPETRESLKEISSWLDHIFD